MKLLLCRPEIRGDRIKLTILAVAFLSWRLDKEVVQDRRSIRPSAEQKSAAPKRGQYRLYDASRCKRRECRIKGITAKREHACARFRSLGMAGSDCAVHIEGSISMGRL
jgi:hypothetical protein